MIRRLLWTACCLALLGRIGYAQELRCNVSVSSAQVQGSNQTRYQTLQRAIYDFMNSRSWTQHVYTSEERIECSMYINITAELGNEYTATLQVQSQRPVFNTNYNTTMLNFLDQHFQFTYIENEPLEFSENTFTSNLTSVLAFYAYVIIGLDDDSFSLYGGTESLRKAEQVVAAAQSGREKGWKAYEGTGRNRYWLAQNLNDDRYRRLREFNYKYHRQGLDRLSTETVQARSDIATAMTLLQSVYRARPDQYMYLLQFLYDAKSSEWTNIFAGSNISEEKTRVARILKEIDPSNASRYEVLER